MTLVLQRTSNRSIVLSANQQAAYGGVLADAALTQRQRIDASSVFSVKPSNRTDKNMVGKGTEFATNDQITAWDTDGTIKSVADVWFIGWALALLFGQDTATGAGPYTHNYSVPQVTATMPCTTVYVEETNDVKRKFQDMSMKSVSIDVPERGDITVSADMCGTGRWTEGAMAAGPPALLLPAYLLASDILVSITPTAGALESFVGRQKGISIKLDRGTAPFQSSGDGLFAGSNACGDAKFSVDLTIAANSVDDVNGWFENGTRCAITIATNPANPLQLSFTWPSVRFKANKVGNTNNVTTWALSFDETTSLQVGATAAISAFVINNTAAYLIPA
jgi:hypothetical protein